MKFVNLSIWIVCILAIGVADEELPEFKPVTKLPDDIPTCKRNDPKLKDCLKGAFQQMAIRIKTGVKELNIPPLDPFTLDKSSHEYRNGIVQGRINMRNIRIYGISAAILKSLDFQMTEKDMRFDAVLFLPSIKIEGEYKADIKINDLKLTPKGNFNLSMTDITLRVRPQADIFMRDGRPYLRFTKFDAEPTIGNMKVYASGLMPDPSANALLLEFVNQYWREMYKAALPETRNTWEPFLIKTANRFFANIPLDLLLTTD